MIQGRTRAKANTPVAEIHCARAADHSKATAHGYRVAYFGRSKLWQHRIYSGVNQDQAGLLHLLHDALTHESADIFRIQFRVNPYRLGKRYPAPIHH